jgi:8-oxo-dGTP pyrophosphatase MutT (NUDIX family)
VAVDPEHGLPFFLLGRQRLDATNPLRGQRWNVFGGRRHSGVDVDVFDTAAREFVEETCAELQFFPSDSLPLRDFRDVSAALRAGKFLFSIRLNYMFRKQARAYLLFVCQVPWAPSMPHRFTMLQSACTARRGAHWNTLCLQAHPCLTLAPHHAGTSGGAVPKPCFTEVETVAWWSLPQLRRAVFEREGMLVTHLGESGFIRSMLVPLLGATLCHFQSCLVHTWCGGEHALQ